ncbi:uncharacterized protein LOC116170466 [Photinus pyralis]|nr:uncharacterized protein LOC116170466 [Photinus pyralis]
MKEEFIFDGSFLDKNLCQFCFLEIIQDESRDELDDVALEWNIHRIRQSRNNVAPHGRPVLMFESTEIYNTRDFKVPVAEVKRIAYQRECKNLETVCDEDLEELCKLIMEEKTLPPPKDPYDALTLYKMLKSEIGVRLDL